MKFRNTRNVCLAVLLSSAFSSCGLFSSSPSLKGTLEDDLYTAPGGDFSVRVPYVSDDEREWMQVSESSHADETYVSFGPININRPVYRLSVAKPGVVPDWMSSKDIAANLAKTIGAQLEQGYGTPLVLLDDEAVEVNGVAAHQRRYRQVVPKGVVHQGKEATFIHRHLVLRDAGRTWSAWLQQPDFRRPSEEFLTLEDFVTSVKFLKPNS